MSEIPKGWKLVPEDPDQAMCQAAQWKLREWPKFPFRVVPAYKAMLAAAPTVPAAPVRHDREADRQRFPDPDFNRWLDESVSDCHTVWEAVGDIAAAWAGWDNRQFYAETAAPAGYKLVPIEPTESMVIDGFESTPDPFFTKPEAWDEYNKLSGCQQAALRAKLCWAAMLAAAPAQPETWKVLPSPVDDASAIRAAALEEAAKVPRKYALELADGIFGQRFPEEATAICNASDNMADRIRALIGGSKS